MTVKVREKSIAAENTFTEPIIIRGAFNLSATGEWVGEITTQRRFPNPENYGTHTGAANAATLTDADQNWPADSLIGMYIFNETDGSQGPITDNTATTVTVTLAGGTDDDFDLGDVYSLWRDVPSGAIASNTDRVGTEVEYGILYRAGFKTGAYTSGTVNLRLSK